MSVAAITLALTLAAPAAAQDRLAPGRALAENESLYAPNGSIRLVMQGDCNLVLYSGDTPLWASGTQGAGNGCKLLQSDGGPMRIEDGVGRTIWTAGPEGRQGARLRVLNEGVAIIEQGGETVWSSASGQSAAPGNSPWAGAQRPTRPQPPAAPPFSQGGSQPSSNSGQTWAFPAAPQPADPWGSGSTASGAWSGVPSRLNIGQFLDGRREQRLTSANGRFVLQMQPDCDLVLYDRGRPRWYSDTRGYGEACAVRLERNGDLVIWSNQRAVWSTRTNARNAILILQDDGELVLRDGSRRLWTSNSATRTADPGW